MRLLDRLIQDIRYAFRVLANNPAFAAVAVLSLALGIGANTAIFSLIDEVLLKSMPVTNPEQLVVVARNPERPQTSHNYPDYEYVRDHNKSFSGVIASSSGGANPVAFAVPGEGANSGSQLAASCLVSGNYFQVLGVTPAVGRLFTAEDNKAEGAHPYVVLSYGFWQRRFGGDASVVGKPVTINGSPFNIIGVSRPGFTGTTVGASPDLFVPIMMNRSVNRGTGEWNNRSYWWLTVIARLKPGVTMEQATPEAALLIKQIEDNDPRRRPAPAYDKDREKRNRGTLLAGSGGYSYFRNQVEKPLRVLMAVVGLVLLIACANVANLLLARASSRQKEIAVRLAIGAGRARLVSQLVVETIVVSVLGGLAGLVFSYWGAQFLVHMLPKRSLPIALNVTPDLRLLAFAFGVSVITGIICGLVPALQSTKPNLISALKNESKFFTRARFDLRRVLVVGQVALSLLLLIGAGMFIRSLQNLRNLDPGFARENVLLVQVSPQQGGYKGQRLRTFYEQLRSKVEALPGVRSVSLANITPLAGSRWNGDIAVQGYQYKAEEKPFVDFNSVSPRFFETMGIPIILGRDFRSEDNPTVTPDPNPKPGPQEELLGPPAPVAIVNEAMAKRFFGNENPIGKRFSQGDKFKLEKSFEIVGVVKDSKYFGLREAVEGMIYVPNWRFGAGGRTLCVRSTADPKLLAGGIRRESAGIDSAIPVIQTLTMEEQFDNNISQERMVTTLCGFFGGLALLLAAVGLYGVMAHSVTRRYREIGIRMALGARRESVLWLVLKETAILVILGTAIGVPAALGLTRFVQTFMYGLTPQDPLSIATGVAVLFAITALAGYLPARRATKVDPLVALRYE